MDYQSLLLRIVKTLDESHIPYAITGGYAVSVWGRPRATFDIDVIIELFEPQISSFANILRRMARASYVDEDAMREAIQQVGEFNFIHGDSGIKTDFWIANNSEFSEQKLKRRVPIEVEGYPVYFISAEDSILSKLQWYQMTTSTRQLEDVESIFTISGGTLDREYLRVWAEKLGMKDLLSKTEKKN